METAAERSEDAAYAKAFSAFNNIVEACYGDNLSSDYVSKIQFFAHAYNELKLSITPKIHAVLFHIEEFCSITGRGLAPWSEQTIEACHHDFNKTWENFKVKEMHNTIC